MSANAVDPDPGRGVYAISVAAELVGMGSQTLRLYEQRGLVDPARSAGGTRRYSSDDLDRLRRIAELVSTGLNLAGVAMVLDLQDTNARLRADLLTTVRPEPSAESTRPSPGTAESARPSRGTGRARGASEGV